jgi:hypothetical protein
MVALKGYETKSFFFEIFIGEMLNGFKNGFF